MRSKRRIWPVLTLSAVMIVCLALMAIPRRDRTQPVLTAEPLEAANTATPEPIANDSDPSRKKKSLLSEEPIAPAPAPSMPGSGFSGTILDSAGKGVGSARVLALPAGFMNFRTSREAWQTQESDSFPVATADGQGRYGIDDVPWKVVAVVVEAPDFRQEKREIQLREGEHLEGVDFRLRPGLSLSGRVVSFRSEGISNAVVRSAGAVTERSAQSGMMAGTVTDAKGYFRVSFAESCTTALQVETPHDGTALFEDVQVQPDRPVLLRMPQGATLTGRIAYADGQPAPGVTVQLVRDYLFQTSNWFGNATAGAKLAVASARADAEGRYRIEGIQPSVNLRARLTKGNSEQLAEEVTIPQLGPGESRVHDFLLGAAIIVQGHVFGLDSHRPLPDVRVAYARDGEYEFGVLTGADGRFELRLFEPGTYLLCPVYQPGGDTQSNLHFVKTMNLKRGQQAQQDLYLPDSCAIACRVVDEQGEPIAGASATVVRMDSEQGMYRDVSGRMTDENGLVTAGGLPPNNLAWFEIEKPGYAKGVSVRQETALGGTLPPDTVVLYALTGGIRGRLLKISGEPWADAEFSLRIRTTEGGTLELSGISEPDGSFFLAEGVPRTPLVVEILYGQRTADDKIMVCRWISDTLEPSEGALELGDIPGTPLTPEELRERLRE